MSFYSSIILTNSIKLNVYGRKFLSSTTSFGRKTITALKSSSADISSDAQTSKGKKKKGDDSVAGKYSKTVLLPQTTFDQRANSLQKEPAMQKWWDDNKIYEGLSETNIGEKFVLHDGPPYANGNLHIGHALNKILKDFINKYQILRGRKVRYIPGWDCHGLPIELKVLQSMKTAEREALTPLELRKKAAEFAKSTMEIQKKAFRRYGIWGDWDHPYLTLQPEYEAAQIKVFGDMMKKGHIYRGRKPVHWSPSSRTALAEAELEYPENHISRSVYVGFKVVSASPSLAALIGQGKEEIKLAIWTTTPWTIPANLAVAVNAEISYCLSPSVNGTRYIVGRALLPSLFSKLGFLTPEDSSLLTIIGADLADTTYQHPLYSDRQAKVVIGGDYITVESGTGLVHTAPGHGQEDYITGLKYGLPLLSPVNDQGCFTEEAGSEFVGLDVLGSGNTAVIKALQDSGALIKEEAYPHKYPYDWRTKKPTIFRATEQWFASVSTFRQASLDAINSVQWIPSTGLNRISSMTEKRGDWCISRQRAWGVPIPVFYSKLDNEPLMTNETLSHIESIFRVHGSNAWWEMPIKDLLPYDLREKADLYTKGTDTMDVWFDSGTSWAGFLNIWISLSL
jgi:isoleucyl-tRNA synthetase